VNEGPLVVSAHALDASWGEGIVADAAVFGELDCRAACVATAALIPEPLPLDVVARQLERAERAGPIGAVRVGFVHGAAQVALLAHFLRRVAPESGVVASALRAGTDLLIDADTQAAIVRDAYPAARVVVARAADLAALTGDDASELTDLKDAASRLLGQGARAVIISGSIVHWRVLDLLNDAGELTLLDTARIQAPHVPGLAGTYAAALAAHLARGLTLRDAAEAAQRYVGFRILRGR
jgi:hydroxymethylpyrimidine/phosphomethylpyrimidine kinase